MMKHIHTSKHRKGTKKQPPKADERDPIDTSQASCHICFMEVSVVTLAGDGWNINTVKCLIVIVLEFSSGEQLVQFSTVQQGRMSA